LTNSVINDCWNTGNITGISGGGICQRIYLGTIKNSFNTGKVTVNNEDDDPIGGGIIGNCLASQIIACYNTGEVTGSKLDAEHDLGGIAGSTGGYNDGSPVSTYIIACYNTGKMWSNFENATDDHCIYIGGISGYNGRRGAEIIACYNTGIVAYTATGEEDELGVGNISGYNNYNNGDTIKEPVITACYWKEIEGNPANGIGYKKAASGGAASDEGAIKFASDAWPTVSTHNEWGTGDGSESGKYWKDLGGWQSGSPVYPRLWFE
jgi:hypothetical protein